MDKRIEIFGTTVLTDNIKKKNLIELEYYKTCNNLTNKEHQEHEKPYGIGVTKKCCDEIELNIEQREFNNIFENENEVNKMLNVLLKNQVTPISLRDILEDFVLV